MHDFWSGLCDEVSEFQSFGGFLEVHLWIDHLPSDIRVLLIFWSIGSYFSVKENSPKVLKHNLFFANHVLI